MLVFIIRVKIEVGQNSLFPSHEFLGFMRPVRRFRTFHCRLYRKYLQAMPLIHQTWKQRCVT